MLGVLLLTLLHCRLTHHMHLQLAGHRISRALWHLAMCQAMALCPMVTLRMVGLAGCCVCE